jgi:hypothetical protein
MSYKIKLGRLKEWTWETVEASIKASYTHLLLDKIQGQTYINIYDLPADILTLPGAGV